MEAEICVCFFLVCPLAHLLTEPQRILSTLLSPKRVILGVSNGLGDNSCGNCYMQ